MAQSEQAPLHATRGKVAPFVVFDWLLNNKRHNRDGNVALNDHPAVSYNGLTILFVCGISRHRSDEQGQEV